MSRILKTPLIASTLPLDRWMNELPVDKKHIPLNQLTLIGAHFSASNDVNTNINNIGSTSICNKLERFFAHRFNRVYRFVRRWKNTQQSSVYTQLMQGARIVDLNVCYSEQANMFYATCGNNAHIAAPLLVILGDIRRFLDSHKSEVIILMIRPEPVYRRTMDRGNINGISTVNIEHANSARLIREIRRYLGDILAPKPITNTRWHTLADMHFIQAQVILFYDGRICNDVYLWNTSMLSIGNRQTSDRTQLLSFSQHYVAEYSRLRMTSFRNNEGVKLSFTRTNTMPARLHILVYALDARRISLWQKICHRGLAEMSARLMDNMIENIVHNLGAASLLIDFYDANIQDGALRTIIGLNFI